MSSLSRARRPIHLAGYAALFDIPDAGRDTIERGAFEETLASRSGPFPLLWQHRADNVIGTVQWISEDARGLRVIALIDALRSRAAAALLSGEVNGLSFGYRARRALHGIKGRRLLAIDLFEISLVTCPLQHGARVHMIL